jgi:hypothetical protein
MSFDLKRSHFSIVLEKPVQAGSVITEEGVLLQSVLDAATGAEAVIPATNDASLLIAGFAIRDNADNATTSEVESVTVPSTAPYEVQLRNNNLVSGDGTGSTAQLTAMDGSTKMDNIDVGAAVSGDVNVNVSTGLLAFHSDEAGKTIVVIYRYNLTVAEARLKFYQRNINNEASTLFSQVGVGHGVGEIFTDQFDAAVDWSAAPGTIHSGDAGILTGSGGTALDARVVSVPNVNNPLLGVAFNIGGN